MLHASVVMITVVMATVVMGRCAQCPLSSLIHYHHRPSSIHAPLSSPHYHVDCHHDSKLTPGLSQI